MDHRTLKATIKLMRENGVKHLKTADVEIELAPDAFAYKKSAKNAPPVEPLTDETKGFKGMSDEDVLFWSAPSLAQEDPDA